MTKEEFLAKIHGGLIVSCQALPDEPLFTEAGGVMPLMAKAAKAGGAVGIRASSVRDIKEIKAAVDLPVIGLIKKHYEGVEPFITVTMDEVDALVDCRVEVIAFDATNRPRPDGQTVEGFIEAIKKKYPRQLLMADVATFEEGLTAYKAGVDFVGTTLAGYTEETKDQTEPDLTVIEQLVTSGVTVIAEGKINTPEQAKAVQVLGVYGIVVGSAITRPKDITERFVRALNERNV